MTDIKTKSAIQEEGGASLVYRIFALYLIALPVLSIALVAVLYGFIRGWTYWPQIYLYPFTWLLAAISAQGARPLTTMLLQRKSVCLSELEMANLVVLTRAVGIIFFCLAIGSLGGYLLPR